MAGTGATRHPSPRPKRWRTTCYLPVVLTRLLALLAVGTLVSACALVGDEDADDTSGAASGRGCSASPTCKDRDADGDYCIPLCDTRCRTRHEQTALFASPYEVTGTYDLGRHQGLAIVGAAVTFDERFELDELPSKSRDKYKWTASELEGLPSDMAKKITESKLDHDHTDHPRCTALAISIDRPLGNHGRALSRAPEDAKSRMGLMSMLEDLKPTTKGQPKPSTKTTKETPVAVGKVGECIRKIENGFCDSVCGNCSYVLPSAGVMTSASGDWSEPADIILGPGKGTCDAESYYGGEGKKSEENVMNERYNNPFTHCAILGCEKETEAPSLKSLIDSSPMTGMYGHNSNTDAEAEAQAFEACLKGADPIRACAACGTTTNAQPARQNPCLAKTNTANNFWARTARPGIGGTFTDLVPPIRGGNGPQLAAPTCAWAPNMPVNGM